MKRFYEIISVILHPLVVPTITLILYIILLPNNYSSAQQLALLSLVFVTTYLIPLLVLILFKKLKLIKTFNVNSIKEIKIAVAIMLVLFYLLGNTITNNSNMKEIGLLFYATSAALTLIYVFFTFRLKLSIHLLSLGISTGFFIIVGFIYSHNIYGIVIANILLAGLVGNARIYLKAAAPKEIYLGFFCGFIAPFGLYYIL